MKGYTIQHSIELLEEEVKNGGGSGGSTTAANVSYDNTDSGLTAETVQAAIDEIDGTLDTATGNISTLSGKVTALEGKAAGVCFDSSNVIQATAEIQTSASYTATEDCVVLFDFIIPTNTAASISMDSISIFTMYSGSQLMEYVDTLFLPAGKSITMAGGSSGSSTSKYTVYGIYEPTPSNSRSKKKK